MSREWRIIGYCGLTAGSIDLSTMVTCDPPDPAEVAKLLDPKTITEQFPDGYVPIYGLLNERGRIIEVRIQIQTPRQVKSSKNPLLTLFTFLTISTFMFAILGSISPGFSVLAVAIQMASIRTGCEQVAIVESVPFIPSPITFLETEPSVTLALELAAFAKHQPDFIELPIERLNPPVEPSMGLEPYPCPFVLRPVTFAEHPT